VPRPVGHCARPNSEVSRSKYADLCSKAMSDGEDVVTLQFYGKNYTTFPSLLKEHSPMIKELLDLQTETGSRLNLDFKRFSARVGAMFLEVTCSGGVSKADTENRAQYISNLMKLYQLGHFYGMDNMMTAAINAFSDLYPKPNGVEAYDFIHLLRSMPSAIGNDYVNEKLKVTLKSEDEEDKDN
ncbi:hypothetical protein MP638_006919, partial [Amoeboaphelidium occidentale]